MKVKKLSIQPSNCDCERCSQMCHAPCCGSPQDIHALIDAGLGGRLMFDDIEDAPGAPPLLKPALKGYEGGYAPWQTASMKGCTFWKDGKCELHDKGLKPIQGKLALHSMSDEENDTIGDFIKEVWKGEEAKEVIERWKKIYLKEE